MKLLLIGTGYVGMALLQNWPSPTFTTLTTTPAKLEKLAPYNPQLLEIKQDTDLSSLLNGIDGIIITAGKSPNRSYEESYLHIAQAVKASLIVQKKPLYLLYTSSTGATSNPILQATEEVYTSIPDAEVCILRLGGIYGPGRTLEERAKKISEKGLSGTGEEVTNHIHLDDIVEAIKFCIENRVTGLFNLVNDDHPKRLELYQAICRKYNWPLPKINGETPARMLTNYPFSNEAIKNQGYVFRHPHLLIE